MNAVYVACGVAFAVSLLALPVAAWLWVSSRRLHRTAQFEPADRHRWASIMGECSDGRSGS